MQTKDSPRPSESESQTLSELNIDRLATLSPLVLTPYQSYPNEQRILAQEHDHYTI